MFAIILLVFLIILICMGCCFLLENERSRKLRNKFDSRVNPGGLGDETNESPFVTGWRFRRESESSDEYLNSTDINVIEDVENLDSVTKYNNDYGHPIWGPANTTTGTTTSMPKKTKSGADDNTKTTTGRSTNSSSSSSDAGKCSSSSSSSSSSITNTPSGRDTGGTSSSCD